MAAAEPTVGALSDDFIHKMPKTDLHCHLDGSLRLSTLIELAEKYDVELPDTTEDGLREKVFKEVYRDLPDYLRGFALTCSVLKTPEALERVAYEFACDNYDENVYYFEVRFAPQLHAGSGEEGDMDIKEVIRSVNRGLVRARDEYNAKREEELEARMVGGVPPPTYNYGIIVCAMRFFNQHFSKYYRHFCEVHKYEPEERLYSLASMALVTAAVSLREEEKTPVVALDIAGAEGGYPAEHHTDAYAYAHMNFLSKTVHAGEGHGAESISQAVRHLHAERIGHGTKLFDQTMVRDPKIIAAGATEYCERLAQFVADRRILLEVCLTSNQQTMPELRHDLSKHAFRQMLDWKMSVTLATDNRLVSRTSVSKEYRLARDTFTLKPREVRELVIAGFKRSFYPDKYRVKRAYVRSIMDYYDAVAFEMGAAAPDKRRGSYE